MNVAFNKVSRVVFVSCHRVLQNRRHRRQLNCLNLRTCRIYFPYGCFDDLTTTFIAQHIYSTTFFVVLFNGVFIRLLTYPTLLCSDILTMHLLNSTTYYDKANMISELFEMKDCNNDDVLNKEECNAVISYISTI